MPLHTTAVNQPNTYYSSSPQRAERTKNELGKNDFLQLLVVELRNQDIFAAADNKEFMGQLAQFSALEQMQNVASGLEKLASAQMMIHGSTLLGRTVEGRSMDDPSVIVSGEVTEVSFGSEGVVVSVDGSWVRLSDIIRLKATADA
ncbi:MAG: flagellar hook capping FlgD N-terminal domain-containing protein [Bacillota bacterium]|jgi:flagellar basal-body rod modification protein FlgD|nr:flagellar hook capping protein [Bacillota bacterium]HOB92342.1 flagellar hook capping FlgD N-terminal domain-containing protein [Bacillota bacterium]HPZ54625.1 flagellar hook capping FlgD N-terminal domain-containing protein [Bacillota bacterium]HQD18864.1 flagellar hook capping FlgD N-terminal domain-containing protein [Bacillota bacterium]